MALSGPQGLEAEGMQRGRIRCYHQGKFFLEGALASIHYSWYGAKLRRLLKRSSHGHLLLELKEKLEVVYFSHILYAHAKLEGSHLRTYLPLLANVYSLPPYYFCLLR